MIFPQHTTPNQGNIGNNVTYIQTGHGGTTNTARHPHTGSITQYHATETHGKTNRTLVSSNRVTASLLPTNQRVLIHKDSNCSGETNEIYITISSISTHQAPSQFRGKILYTRNPAPLPLLDPRLARSPPVTRRCLSLSACPRPRPRRPPRPARPRQSPRPPPRPPFCPSKLP